MQICMGKQIYYSGNSIGRTKYLPQQTILSGLNDTISFVLHEILTMTTDATILTMITDATILTMITDATIYLTQQTTFPGLKGLTYTLQSFHCIHQVQTTLSIINEFNIRLYHYVL